MSPHGCAIISALADARSRSCRRAWSPRYRRDPNISENFSQQTPVVTVVAMDNLRSGDAITRVGWRAFSGEDIQHWTAGGSSSQSEGGLFSRIARGAGGAERKFAPGDRAGAAGSDRGALASCCGSIWLERRCDFREYRLHVPGHGDRWRGKHRAFLDDTLEPDPLIRSMGRVRKERRAKRWPSSAAFIGGLFLPSSAGEATRWKMRRI